MTYSVKLNRTLFMCYGDDPTLDKDQDGLVDFLELKLATAFCPYLKFDSHEKARLPNEPYVLFQVTPTPWMNKVWIRWVFLFREDGGYGPASVEGSDDHEGDNDKATFWLRTPDQGITWILERINLGGGFYGLEWPTNTFNLEVYNYCATDNCVHPIIYQSAHKHHLYFNTNWDDENSYYSDWGYNDNVDGKGFGVLPNLKSLNKNNKKYGNNVGEENFHNAPFLVELTPFPYKWVTLCCYEPYPPKYCAWDKRYFYAVGSMFGCWIKGYEASHPPNLPPPADLSMPPFVQRVKVISASPGLQPSGFGKLQGCTSPIVAYDAEWIASSSAYGIATRRELKYNVHPLPVCSDKETLIFVLFGPLKNGKGRTVKPNAAELNRVDPGPGGHDPLKFTPAMDPSFGQYYWVRVKDFQSSSQAYVQRLGIWALDEQDRPVGDSAKIAAVRMHDPNYSIVGYISYGMDCDYVIKVSPPLQKDNYGNNHSKETPWNLGELTDFNPLLAADATITNGETDYFSLSWKAIGLPTAIPGLGPNKISIVAKSPFGNNLVTGILEENGNNQVKWFNSNFFTIPQDFQGRSAVIAVKCPNFSCQGVCYYNLKVRYCFKRKIIEKFRKTWKKWEGNPDYPNERKVRIGDEIAYSNLKILVNDLDKLIRLFIDDMELFTRKDRLLTEAKMRKDLGVFAGSIEMKEFADYQMTKARDLEKRARE
ncbi:MAG: hypothetical protein CW691_02350 [Candidatus Bathyarchaeum sp.]|nr:MAG: hypothetical protein CW691_02350 [Candidatus Bathyarchaeum sp.]